MKKKYIKPSIHTLTVAADLIPEKGLAEASDEELAYIHKESLKRMLGKKYVASKNVVARPILDEWILIPIDEITDGQRNGMYSQNAISHYLWELFQEPVILQDVISRVREDFNGDEEKIETDVLRFVDEYLKYKLIKEV